MMKLFSKIFLYGALCLTPSFLFAGYKPQSGPDSRFLLSGDSAKVGGDNPDSTKGPFVSKLVLSQEGEPLCVVDVGQSPHLLPPFWSASPSIQGPSELDLLLPPCGNEERNLIHKLTQNSFLLEEGDLGVEVAGVALAVPLISCIGGAFFGAGYSLLSQITLDEWLEFDIENPGNLVGSLGLMYFGSFSASVGALDGNSKILSVRGFKQLGIAGFCGGTVMTLLAITNYMHQRTEEPDNQK